LHGQQTHKGAGLAACAETGDSARKSGRERPMLSLQEMSDRLEIQDLLARYSFAIDERDWDALDRVFTPDAHIDYSEAGGASGSYPQIKAWLPKALERFAMYQHMVATTRLEIDGDRATSRTILFNPMVGRDDRGGEQVFFIGLWYRDKLVRTADGWRIAERYEEMSYRHNMPAMDPAPDIE
jgi:SnoaL-like domain